METELAEKRAMDACATSKVSCLQLVVLHEPRVMMVVKFTTIITRTYVSVARDYSRYLFIICMQQVVASRVSHLSGGSFGG